VSIPGGGVSPFWKAPGMETLPLLSGWGTWGCISVVLTLTASLRESIRSFTEVILGETRTARCEPVED